MAQKYSIQQGYNPNIPNQIKGLLSTHQKMLELNQIIIDIFSSLDLKVLSFPPSLLFIEEDSQLRFYGKEILEQILHWKIIPVLFGDVLFTSSHNFKILSGDTIISHLCFEFGDHIIKNVIFSIDQDGILEKEKDSDQLHIIPHLTPSELKRFHIKDPFIHIDKKFDVTGAMAGKIKEIIKISNIGITVKIINGKTQNLLLDTLFDRERISTTISEN